MTLQKMVKPKKNPPRLAHDPSSQYNNCFLVDSQSFSVSVLMMHFIIGHIFTSYLGCLFPCLVSFTKPRAPWGGTVCTSRFYLQSLNGSSFTAAAGEIPLNTSRGCRSPRRQSEWSHLALCRKHWLDGILWARTPKGFLNSS